MGEVEEPRVREGVSHARDGALVLSDVHSPTLSIICEPCGRRGTYSVARLMERHGDVKLTNLLQMLADCPKVRSASIHDRCKWCSSGYCRDGLMARFGADIALPDLLVAPSAYERNRSSLSCAEIKQP